VGLYRTRYADRAFLPKGYGQRLSQLMAALRQKYGIGKRQGGNRRRMHAQNEQMELF